ncbi:MAG: ATP-dependent DNA helicase RecG [Fibromonadales bacterium]|nr:ATP-dependent DNA helicase RecG [Fibromonadales bacterium]
MHLSSIPSLGPKRIAALNKRDINTPWDLLQLIPREWLDERQAAKIKDVRKDAWVVVDGYVANIEPKYKRLSVILQDESGAMEITFWNAKSFNYWQSKLKKGMRLVAKGRASEFSMMQLSHPEILFLKSDEKYSGSIKSVYSKQAGVESMHISNFIKYLLQKDLRLILEPDEHACPPELLSFLGLRPLMEIFKSLHSPQTIEEAYAAKRENKILELLPFCLRMAKRRKLLANSGISRKFDLQKMEFAKNNLPFSLTAGQVQVLEQMKSGLESSRQFHALLQGDVGSGKTVIAILTMIGVCGAGTQSACMVPTDILARQHFSSMEKVFESIGLKLALLVGAIGAAERREILAGLKSGEINVVVGTHALFSKDVEFSNLGFVIIDEQHRFGVRQREALLAKGNKPDLLVMSATPIPRSLAMTFYGDLEAIVLNEKPPGRKPIATKLVSNEKREDMKNYLYRESLNDNRCYLVVSRVQEDELGEARSVGDVYEELKKFKSDWKIAVVHGQMPELERDANLNAFAKGEISLLVCTTVVEVGVNVPEANLIAIDKPESFGLAQLHQLRGRVGRGSELAWCFLMCNSDNVAFERLSKFSKTNDGFEIAEMDLQNRGAGNLEGSDQSGAWVLRSFDWVQDKLLIEKTINIASQILDNKPDFSPEVLQKIQNWYNDKKFEKIEDGVH